MNENGNLNERMAEILNGLTDEQKEKAKACKTPKELIALLGEMGVAQPDELLEAISGGWGDVVKLPPEYDDYFAGMPLPR